MLVARLIARTMLFMTVIIGSFILVSVYIQSKSLQCTEFTTAEASHGGPYFEPMMATSEPDDEYSSGQRHIPLSLRMSGRAGVSVNDFYTIFEIYLKFF